MAKREARSRQGRGWQIRSVPACLPCLPALNGCRFSGHCFGILFVCWNENERNRPLKILQIQIKTRQIIACVKSDVIRSYSFDSFIVVGVGGGGVRHCYPKPKITTKPSIRFNSFIRRLIPLLTSSLFPFSLFPSFSPSYMYFHNTNLLLHYYTILLYIGTS